MVELTLPGSGIWYNKRQKAQVSASAWKLEKVLPQECHAALERLIELGDGTSILEGF